MTIHGATTTTDQVLDGIDLSGRRYVITGASTGLGEEASRAVAAHGARVVMLGRDAERLDAAAERVRSQVPDAAIETGVVDLASFASIRSFAEGFLVDQDGIDVLMNNAGVMACPFGQTADGHELQFGTNHLGHFLLTGLLFPAVMAGDAPRIVNLSSAAHSICDVDLDDPGFGHGDYDPWVAYGRSKSANAHFSRALARRYGASGLLAFAVHPGGIQTDLGRHLTPELIDQLMERTRARSEAAGDTGGGGGLRFKSIEAGAATQVWASVADIADHNGAYLADCQVGVEGGNPNGTGFASWIVDDATADALWDLSEGIVGLRYPDL